jgi:hypothetical protein
MWWVRNKCTSFEEFYLQIEGERYTVASGTIF